MQHNAASKQSQLEWILLSLDPNYDFDLTNKCFYAEAGGGSRFYETRSTDGNRPVIYAEHIPAHQQGCDLLVGLGCGDSAIEHALFRAFEPTPSCFIGIDASGEMLNLSRARFSDVAATQEWWMEDFLAPSVIGSLCKRLERNTGDKIVLLTGRTFGNLDLVQSTRALKPLVDRATLYVDMFSLIGPDAEMRFRERMIRIAHSSRDFFLAPLRCSGVQTEDLDVAYAFYRTTQLLCCDFHITLGETGVQSIRPGRYRLFSIRIFDIGPLCSILRKRGYEPVFRLDMPEQVLPMTLLGFRGSQ